MTVLVVYQRFPKGHALGALVRREGIARGLVANGLTFRAVGLPRRRRTLSEVFSVGLGSKMERAALYAAAEDSQAILLEGLPTALACIGKLRKRTSATIHVDICDSWVRLSGAGKGSGISFLPRWLRRIKRVVAALALRYVGSRADSLSYISELDLESDSPWLGRAARTFVLSNGSPVPTDLKDDFWRFDGPMVVVGDWSYPPNQEMLRTVLEWYSAEGQNSGLRIVGPNLTTPTPITPDINVLGWVAEISDAYKGVSCALAPTLSGSGVKNKVLEPLSYGVPVIATDEALNGIQADAGMTLQFSTALTYDKVRSWLESLRSDGVQRLRAPSWEQNATELAAFLGGKGK